MALRVRLTSGLLADAQNRAKPEAMRPIVEGLPFAPPYVSGERGAASLNSPANAEARRACAACRDGYPA